MKWRMNKMNMYFRGTARRHRDYTRIGHTAMYVGLLGKPFPHTTCSRLRHGKTVYRDMIASLFRQTRDLETHYIWGLPPHFLGITKEFFLIAQNNTFGWGQRFTQSLVGIFYLGRDIVRMSYPDIVNSCVYSLFWLCRQLLLCGFGTQLRSVVSLQYVCPQDRG